MVNQKRKSKAVSKRAMVLKQNTDVVVSNSARLIKAKLKETKYQGGTQQTPIGGRQSARITSRMAAGKIRTFTKLLPRNRQSKKFVTVEKDKSSPTTKLTVSTRLNQDVAPTTDEGSSSKPKRTCQNRSCLPEDATTESLIEESASDAGGVVKRKIVHKKRPCEICGRQFNSFYLPVHLRTHTGEKPFACECGKLFTTESLLSTHRIRHHSSDTSVLQCDICHKLCASKGSLKMHSMVHSEERPYKCQHCDKSFKQPGVLSEHEKTHTPEHSFQCETCGKSFRNKRSVMRHQEVTHVAVIHDLPCPDCDKVFQDRSSLWRHRKRHNVDYVAPLQCELCHRRFHESKVLATHMLIHSDVKPFKCSSCDKTFRHQSVLKRHMSIHTGVKPFRCVTCNRQFVHRVYLLRHKRCRPKENPAVHVTDSSTTVAPSVTAKISSSVEASGPTAVSPFAPNERVPRFALSSRVHRSVAAGTPGTQPAVRRRSTVLPRKRPVDVAGSVRYQLAPAQVGVFCPVPVVEQQEQSTSDEGCMEGIDGGSFLSLAPVAHAVLTVSPNDSLDDLSVPDGFNAKNYVVLSSLKLESP